MKEYKIVVAGNGGVGKSALTVQFVQGFFVQNYDATIEDSYRKQVEIDGQLCRLEILDTAGTEQFSGMRDLYIKNGQGFVLVYAVNDANSFRDLTLMKEMIYRLKDAKQVPIVIVGNKCDLVTERVVSRAEGLELAKHSECSFVESSAKTNQNVNEIFHDIVKQINRLQDQNQKNSSKGRNGKKQKKNMNKSVGDVEDEQKNCCGCSLL